MFAGSIFDLEPATEYECRLVLSDPDGVEGKAEHIVTVRTRFEPKPAAGGRVYHVYPADYMGPKQEPVDYDVFQKVSPPGPDPLTLYRPSDFDFRLRPGSAPVDAGVRLPNINDDFTGLAPDLGAYEVGRLEPHYGPRPQ